MVTTDHGGPNHSKVNLEQAYPELLKSREAVPELLQFYGMEFDTPAADHSTLIIPKVIMNHKLFMISKVSLINVILIQMMEAEILSPQ